MAVCADHGESLGQLGGGGDAAGPTLLLSALLHGDWVRLARPFDVPTPGNPVVHHLGRDPLEGPADGSFQPCLRVAGIWAPLAHVFLEVSKAQFGGVVLGTAWGQKDHARHAPLLFCRAVEEGDVLGVAGVHG